MKNSNQNQETVTVNTRLLYSLTEAAFQLSISKRGLAYILSQGLIPVRKLGGRTMVTADALRAFANSDTHVNIVPQRKGR